MFYNRDGDDGAGDDDGGGNDEDAKEAGWHQHQYQIYQEKARSMSMLSSRRENAKKQHRLAGIRVLRKKTDFQTDNIV